MQYLSRPPAMDAPASTCPTCARGCGCPALGPGCGHYGCFGAAPRTCPGVEAEEARYAAVQAAVRAEEARTLNRRAALARSYEAAVAATIVPRRLSR